MVTKEQFLRYYKVLNSGTYDMITESNEAMVAANLTSEDYKRIQIHYSDYYNEYIV